MPLVAVVTAAKNAEAFLPDAIASIAAQSFGDWEHVIVDDGSTDSTGAIADAAAANDHRVRVVHLSESLGSYGAANHVMLGLDAKYVARLDADDLAMPRRLQVQVDALENSKHRAHVSAFQALRPTHLETRVRVVPSHNNGALKWMLWFRNGFIHSTAMIETAAFRELGGYGPERVAEDYRLWCRLARRGWLGAVDESLVHYRFHDAQVTAVTNSKDDPARLRCRLDHMQACDDGEWSLDDARDFRNVGLEPDLALERVMGLFDTWERMWRADESLDAEARGQLANYGAFRLAQHMKRLVKRRPGELAAVTARRAPTVLGSVARRAVTRQPDWQ